MEHVEYPVLSDSENARSIFGDDILFALRDVFGEAFKKFTVLFQVKRVPIEGGEVFVYMLHSHQVKFAGFLRNRHLAWWKQAMAYRALDGHAKARAREEINETQSQEGKVWANWSLSAELDFSSSLSAFEITYDPQTLSVKMQGIERYSVNPADYPQHLSTTSELLKYFASASRMPPVALAGDIGWAINDFRLMKVLVGLLDGELNLDAISIDAADFEDWDYFNAKFEAEVLASRPTDRGRRSI